ncbi:MAG TPA: hypothetical protein VGQ76_24365 [Thermoanaerobaculia bacterium]|nr:hypothetical protein [Thermoanaerobaculia bacterium]
MIARSADGVAQLETYYSALAMICVPSVEASQKSTRMSSETG